MIPPHPSPGLHAAEHATDAPSHSAQRPALSFVMPCYNEEAIVAYTISRLLAAFEHAGHRAELIAVDNGSSDRTGAILRDIASRRASVIFHRVDRNLGYGNGILCGIRKCTAPWVCIIPADGQVDEDDVVRLYEATVMASDAIGKVRRRFRMDGLRRKLVSIAYNLFIRLLWPRLASWDINGSPKLIRRDHLAQMQLESKDWFLDPEIMIKAHSMGLRVLELNVFARMRGTGVSHVRASTCWEFLTNLIAYRFSSRLAAWRYAQSHSNQLVHVNK